jgi:hypothetical protein
MCKYCNPSDERMKNHHWEKLDNDLSFKSSAYIVPDDKYTRHVLVVATDKCIVTEIVLNYCPMCGAKLSE